jgi:hypothetical protein
MGYGATWVSLFFLEKRTTKRIRKKNYKNQQDGVRGNLGFPTTKKMIFLLN